MQRSDRNLRRAALVIALLLSAGWPSRNAKAQTETPDAFRPSLTPDRARELVLAAADAIDRMYVDAAQGKRIADALRARAADDRYSGAGTVTALADRLSADLQEIAHDRRLAARFDPGTGSGVRIHSDGPAGPPSERGPAGGGETRVRVVNGGGIPDPVRAREQRRTNFGFHSVERLDGNVGYLDVREFAPLALAKNTAASAMAFLSNSDAVIVDLRNCPGGAPDAVSFLASYFFGPERRELFSRYDRVADETRTEYTSEDLPGRRMPATDLWILVGPGTASAGESFAYLLQQFGRATVVGERTAGAGYNVATLPLGDGLVVGISVARPIHPKTGKGWEGEGVLPDIAASSRDALATAHTAALRKLARAASDATRRRELEWAVERVSLPASARLSTAEQTSLTGRYGERTVAVEDGRLVCRAPNGRSRSMNPIGNDSFTWDEQTRASFPRDAAGRPIALLLERSDGTVERFLRQSDDKQ
jgi:hypothetical protein